MDSGVSVNPASGPSQGYGEHNETLSSTGRLAQAYMTCKIGKIGGTVIKISLAWQKVLHSHDWVRARKFTSLIPSLPL